MSDDKTGCAVGDMSLYRTGEKSACTGPLHKLFIQWEVRGGWKIEGEKPATAVVCEGHLPTFMESGKIEGNTFSIVSNELVKSLIAGEKET